MSSNYGSSFSVKPSRDLPYSPKNPFQIREFRVFRRRRLKNHRPLSFTLRSQLNPFENLFNSLISQFPSVNSLELIAPALGFASGVALYLSRFDADKARGVSDIGEWVLFTSPSPFNRFVLLRCPSISFPGGDLLENVNEKLVKEDRHFVRLNTGRITVSRGDEGRESSVEEKLRYQRVCVSTGDGGVISLDWPDDLDLKKEHGLDTTLLLVPGTPDGSMDKSIRFFVSEALRRGYFPVVMNPRGCAGSPLTTARLFTAADSDDISTAIHFISNARPWTALMGLGLGYGANMLTKYMAEAGEKTPLTAATCIDNPFDLGEATRSPTHHMSIDQKLTSGLISILRSNKELFQGRTKGFDVEKALSAKSIREFERAISMVSYGYGTIEEFYSGISTRGVIGKVKIPVLFIQNDDGSAPLFSIPRSLIADNPFTSLLLCSYFPSGVIAGGHSSLTWCHHLAIEWLSAVELGLLKGRHPLLRDVDVTIDPSTGLALTEGRKSDKDGKDELLGSTLPNVFKGYPTDTTDEMLRNGDGVDNIRMRYRNGSLSRFQLECKGFQVVEDGILQQTSSSEAELVKENEISLEDSESGQILPTAQVVMNLLDMTTPGILTAEKKKKVLDAVGRGETLMKALEDAVPEDVREKLKGSVSVILHQQGTSLTLKELLGVPQTPDVSIGSTSYIQEKNRGMANAPGFSQDHLSADEMRESTDSSDHSRNCQPEIDKPSAEEASELQSEKSHSSANSVDGMVLEARSKLNFSDGCEEAEAREQTIDDEHKDRGNEIDQQNNNCPNKPKKNEEESLDSSSDHNKVISPAKTEEAPSTQGSSESQPLEREQHDDQANDIKTAQPSSDQNKHVISDPNAPTFTVSQALDALTGIDDSTQVAVNSVFGVIESMITQMEEDSNDVSEVTVLKNGSLSDIQMNNHQLEKNKDCELEVKLQSDETDSPLINGFAETIMDSQQDTGCEILAEESTESLKEGEEESIQSLEGESSRSLEDYSGESLKEESTQGLQENYTERLTSLKRIHANSSLAGQSANELDSESNQGQKLIDNFVAHGHFNTIPPYIISNQLRSSFHNDHFGEYLVSKLPTISLDMDTTSALLLDYIPEEGQWKLLEQSSNGNSVDSVSTQGGAEKFNAHLSATANDADKFIEPPYVVLGGGDLHEPIREYGTAEKAERVEDDEKSKELQLFVKDIVLQALKVEVCRRLNMSNKKGLEPNLLKDVEHVASLLSLAVSCEGKKSQCLEGKTYCINLTSEKVGALHGKHIIRAVSSSVQKTKYLRKVLPLGVIVGSTLAALRKFFNVTTTHKDSLTETLPLDQPRKSVAKTHGKPPEMKTDQISIGRSNGTASVDRPVGPEINNTKNLNNGTVMAGAVTAAIGASAFMMQQQNSEKPNQSAESRSKFVMVSVDQQEEADRAEETAANKSHINLVTSLAEKAMSVASPVVPTKEDGEVDQERLVAMLADLGQRGGLLRLVGKLALLWGGLRGAMSLTDRLISFLRIAERPLLQRIVGFVGMMLVLWSPVAIPLLPILVQSWTAKTTSRITELAIILGLYTAVLIEVMLWGRRIRGYENPLKQYGLDLTSLSKVYDFLKGLLGGVMLVLGIQLVNGLLGFASLSWLYPSSSMDAMASFKAYGKLFILAVQGVVTATVVTAVEELLFRSWLPAEIAADLGYKQGIVISGLAFSLFQRSPQAIPALWLLSLGLSGARQRTGGSLAVPIGLRAGIMSSSFVLQKGGFLSYKPDVPLWVTGVYPFQPLSGVVGFAFALLLACIFFPQQPVPRKPLERTIRK